MRHTHGTCTLDATAAAVGEERKIKDWGQWRDGMGSTHEVVPTQPPHANGRVHVRPMRCIRGGPSKMESGTDDKTRRNESWWHESAT